MRQIGVHHFVGEHPAIIEAAVEYVDGCEKTKAHQEYLFNSKKPSRKFFDLLNKQATKPRAHTVDVQHDFWRIGEDTLIEIFPEEELPDVDNASDFIVHLNILYVCDINRGKGKGRRTMDLLKQLAEQSGCVLTLVAAPFGYHPDGTELPFALNSWNELWQTVVDRDWKMIYLTELDLKAISFFYEQCGLTNICLARETDVDDDGKPERFSSNHFCYLPDTLENKHRELLEPRLNLDLCPWCLS